LAYTTACTTVQAVTRLRIR